MKRRNKKCLISCYNIKMAKIKLLHLPKFILLLYKKIVSKLKLVYTFLIKVSDLFQELFGGII